MKRIIELDADPDNWLEIDEEQEEYERYMAMLDMDDWSKESGNE